MLTIYILKARTFLKQWIYRAISLLEQSLLSSPANFHIKILLVRVYLEVGLVVAADSAFALLDVKHLQLDSLGYLHVSLLAPLGNLPLASTTLDQTTKFFVANYKDVCVFKHNKLKKMDELYVARV